MLINHKGFYPTSKNTTQKHFLELINRIDDLNLTNVISTNLDNPNCLELNLEGVFLLEEYSKILEEKDVYKTIEYITSKSLKISKVKVYVNDTFIVFYPSAIYFTGEKKKLDEILINLKLNPNTYLYSSKNIVKTPEQDAPWYNNGE